MTEFTNYTVDLFLKDGSVSSGRISSVDESKIVLNDVTNSNSPASKFSIVEFLNNHVADLKVKKLPPDLIKSMKSKNKKDNKKEQKPSKTKVQKEEPIAGAQPSGASAAVSNDFDFAANLAMFDKKSVFEDFQKKDTVKPEFRLVGHNKVNQARKDYEKFGNDEMILQGKTDNWDMLGSQEHKEAVRNASVTRRSTPVPDATAGSMNKNYNLVNFSTKNVVPVCSPIQLSDIERLAQESFSHTPALMAEVFATNLSLYICQKLLGGAARLNPSNHNLPPLVLLLIGGERCSTRAYAVGRHLANHGVRVLAYCVSLELTDESYLAQKALFQQAGGKIISTTVADLLNILNNQLDTPVELIIDALQGYDAHLEDIFYETKEQDLVRELLQWCNEPRQRSKIMSLDIPSGIDGGSGTVSDNSLLIHSRYCVSMGVPVAGILHAYRYDILSIEEEDRIKHLLIDIGIPNKVYQKKSNLRKFDKLWYGAEHIVELNLVEKIE